MNTCKVDGCDRRHHGRGRCVNHYNQWLYARNQKNAPAHCSVEGCWNRPERRGWCRKHYKLWREHGDPCWTPAPAACVDCGGPPLFQDCRTPRCLPCFKARVRETRGADRGRPAARPSDDVGRLPFYRPSVKRQTWKGAA